MNKHNPKRFHVRAELRLKNARLVATREELGMNVKQFAIFVGISYPQYCGYETLRVYPSAKHRKLLANLCCCEPEELFPLELNEVAKDEGSRILVSVGEVELSRLLGANRREVLALSAPENIEKDLEVTELSEITERLLSALKEREAKVLKLYFGFDGDPMTLEEIAKILGITRERTRQIKEKALFCLRHASRARYLEEFAEQPIARHVRNEFSQEGSDLDSQIREGLEELHRRLARKGF
ncbi:MAG: sigma-70 family RNA polymerase sigma factor [bacterium]